MPVLFYAANAGNEAAVNALHRAGARPDAVREAARRHGVYLETDTNTNTNMPIPTTVAGDGKMTSTLTMATSWWEA
eukprot:16294888-Heterocapsa_arctica.AAC.1